MAVVEHTPDPEEKWPARWHLPATWADLVVLVVFECIASPICIAAGETFVKADYARSCVGWLIGIPLAVVGFTAHWWKKWIAAATREFIHRQAIMWSPVAILLAFIYVVNLNIYPRGTSAAASSSAAPDAFVVWVPAGRLRIGEIYDLLFDGRLLGFWWDGAYLQMQRLVSIESNNSLAISSFYMAGKNLGPKEVQLHSAYLVSGVDGTRLPMNIDATPDGWVAIGESGAVLRKAEFVLRARFAPESNPLSEAEFRRRWSYFDTCINAGDEEITHRITADVVRSWFDANHPERTPQVTCRQL